MNRSLLVNSQSCMPAYATTVLFASILIADVVRQEYWFILGHALFGIVCILMMNVLCQNNAAYVGWVLLFIPALLVAIGWTIIGIRNAEGKLASAPTPAVAVAPAMSPAPAPAPTPTATPVQAYYM